MALLTSRRQATRPHEDLAVAEPPVEKRAARWRWRLLAGAFVLAVLLWFLPTIVTSTPLLGWILSRATAEMQGTVRVGSASLGWLSPISVQDIEVRDPQGNPILEAASLSADRSLAHLLSDWTHLGNLRLVGPKLTLVLRDDGSNVEDLLAPYLVSTDESTPVAFALEIVDGRVVMSDEGNGRIWSIENVELSASSSTAPGEGFSLAAAATLADTRQPGAISVKWTSPADTPDGDSERSPVVASELKVEADRVPLAMFRSLLKRFAPETQLAGMLSGQFDAQFGHDAAARTTLRAELAGEDLVFHGPWFEADRLQLARLDATCHVALHDGVIDVDPSSIECDLGAISASGSVDLAGRSDTTPLAWLSRQTCQIEGHIDLARLARVLPATLRVRPGTEITSGQVQLSATSGLDPTQPESNTMTWNAEVEVGQLAARHEGRQLAWEKPIRLSLAAHDTPEGPTVERLFCDSDFLRIDTAGTPEKLAASAEFDLDRLAEQLGQFFDLGGIGFAGKGWAHLDFSRSQDRQFQADGELQVRDFQLVMPERPVWAEPQLLLFASARGTDGTDGVAQLRAASLELSTSTDQLRADLTRPVSNAWNNSVWPLRLSAAGQLQNWPERLRTWIALDDWQPAGAFRVDALATASTTAVTVAEATLSIDQFRLLGPSLNIAEPSVRATFSGEWDAAEGRVLIEPASLTSQSVSVQAGRLLLHMPEGAPPRVSAVGQFQGDLARLQRWLDDPHAPSATRVAGRLSGNIDLTQPEGTTRAKLDAEVANLAVTFASGEQYRDPKVRLAAVGDYEPRTRLLRLESLDLATETLAVRAAGRVASGDEATDVGLSGQIQYDLERLSTLAQPYLGSGIRVVGRGTSPVAFSGPLDAAHARADAALRWQGADAYGFQIGPGTLTLALAEGIVRAEPLDLAVNGGRLTVAPQVRLSPGPPELHVRPGRLVQNVQITPAMCASALKYIAPVLADVSMARGTFSIELDGCRVRLDDPAQSELAGRLTIHSVEVGPGPLVREMAILLGRAAPATLRRESVVQFRMVDGRVYHQGLELAFPDLTIRTYGSVGLDQSMAIMAEMPIPPKWLGDNVLGTALRNQTIRLPIAGTLSQPKIDQREMERLQAQFLQNAARNVLEDELNRQLDRLFTPPR